MESQSGTSVVECSKEEGMADVVVVVVVIVAGESSPPLSMQ